MNMSPKHMAYAGIVVVGIAIVAVDRFVLSPGGGSPQSASAEPAPAGTEPKPRDAGQPRQPAPAIESAQTHLDYISRLLADASARRDVSSESVRDAFAVSDIWTGRDDSKAQTQRSRTPAEVAAEQFKAAHTLMAVINRGEQRSAFVGNQLVKVGQKIGGATLIAVHGRSADFDVQGERVTLTLPEDGR